MYGYGNSMFLATHGILARGGTPPANTVAPVISGGTSLGSVLTSTTGTWTGDAPITYSYQWKRNGIDIGGATSSTYTIVVADSAVGLTCQVTATNPAGFASAISNTITAQTFTAPVNTIAPAITGTSQEGETLTCSTGTWTANPTPTYAYQWKRNNVNIGSATNSTYLLVTADVGQNIKCTVTATNAVGSANADSNTVVPIAAFSFLLDTYSGAAAAYSLRKLRSAYSGNCIRVRRSSDNTEQNIGFVNNVLDTASLLTFVGAGNGFVTTWYDQSSNANNATNVSATAQPQIVSSGSLITTNGKVALDFDGSNDRLGFTQVTGSTGLTLISVNKYDAISNGGSLWDGSTTITAYSSGFVQDAGMGARVGRTSFYYENNAPLEILGAGSSALTNTQYLQFAYGSSTAAGHAVNNTLLTGTAGRNDLIVRAIANDNSQLTHTYYDGTIQEAIIYTSNKASDRTGIQNNINTFYTIY